MAMNRRNSVVALSSLNLHQYRMSSVLGFVLELQPQSIVVKRTLLKFCFLKFGGGQGRYYVASEDLLAYENRRMRIGRIT